MEKQKYKELAMLSANGDSKSFARLYETIYREMYYTAYYTLADDADAVEVVTDAVKGTFRAIGKLHSEGAFRLHIMKSLCAGIKVKLREYAAEGKTVCYDPSNLRPNEDGIDIKQEFNRLPDTERLVSSLYAGGRFQPDEIAQFTGLSTSTVKKKLERAMQGFALD